MQSKNNVINDILNNLTTLKQIDEQNSNEIDARLHELEAKNNIIIRNFRNLLSDLENWSGLIV